MPITLNHSNIEVQYSSGSNYIIETVKSDLYRKNENIDTIIRNNIQVAPVTPNTYVDNSGNVYAVESYTYNGTANTADYTRVFTKSTVCDILIVGGGGAGDRQIGGGGGGGAVLHATNITIPANTYTIKVGKGGEAGNGGNSEAFGATCLGGGSTAFVGWGTQNNGTVGGSGSGGSSGSPSTATATGGPAGVSTKGALLSSGTLYNGNVGGNGLPQAAAGNLGSGGGGGAGTAGFNSSQTQYTTRSSWIAAGRPSKGGDGVAINITGTTYYWGAGGGGSGHLTHAGDGGLGGGGGGGGEGVVGTLIFGFAGKDGINNGINGSNIGPQNGGNGAPNTGSGGGGGGYNGNSGVYNAGNGGSGIVIIRYLLGTIPINNLFLTNEPTFTSSITPQTTPTLFTFKHKRGTNTQEIYNITFDTDILCDILIVGGGGSSGNDGGGYEPGGGGGGGIVYMVNKTLVKGTYSIFVGIGGDNANGGDSEIRNNDTNTALVFDGISLIGRGGGRGGGNLVGANGGSGGGSSYSFTTFGTATQGNTFWDGTQYVAGGFNGSRGNPAFITGNNGGGGGGAGANALGCEGGHGRLVTITGVNQYYGGGGGAGGGAGGRPGGLGGGGSARIGAIGGLGVKGTNDLGGGGGAHYSSTGGYPRRGGSGIVIIRAYQKVIDKNILTFRHSENYSELQTRYNYTFTKNTICDLLVVGGGGGGGGAGGSGGGGDVVELNNVNFSVGTYTILVGYGGLRSPHNNGISGFNGNNSSIKGNNIDIAAAGGGGGGQYTANLAPIPPLITYTNPLTNILTRSQGGGGGVRFNSIPYAFDSTLSGIGGINTDNNAETGGAGGGAAPNSLGGNGGNSFISSSIGTLGNGGAGIISTITGLPIEYGSGGSGSRWNGGFESTIYGISTGGGGYIEFRDVNNKSYIFNIFKGSFGTGGGGTAVSDGGSGIVILKIKSVIETFYYTPLIKNLNYLINSSSYPYIPADTTNLIAWYKFDGNANDSNPTSVKHNFSTLSGTITYGRDSIINKPYLNLFNGSLSNSTLKLNNRPFTISYLFRLYNHDAIYYIYTSGATTANNTLHIGSRGNNVYMMGFMNNDIDSPIRYHEDVNNWVLFTAIVESNNNRKLYKNGVLIQSDFNTSAYVGVGNLELRLGNVDICDFRVYDRALTQNEITALYIGYMANTFTANFPTRTMANINNSGDELFNGSYTLNVGSSLSTIISTQNQKLKDTIIASSNISISYHQANPILDPIGAQWTYSSSNTNVYHLGSVGVGTTNPMYSLDARGAIYSSVGGYTQTGLTTWTITSDMRIKDNIVRASYEKCLENVKNIELYNFNFKDNCVNTNDKHQLGFIAQEVQKVYPKAVEVNKMILNTNETIDDILTLNTTQIDYTLYGAVKNLIEQIEDIDSYLENIEKLII
jgi:hypothetical protein